MHQPTHDTIRQFQHERQQEAAHQRLVTAARAADRSRGGWAGPARSRVRFDHRSPLRWKPKSKWLATNRALRFVARPR